jgi:hypothetical protein
LDGMKGGCDVDGGRALIWMIVGYVGEGMAAVLATATTDPVGLPEPGAAVEVIIPKAGFGAEVPLKVLSGAACRGK